MGGCSAVPDGLLACSRTASHQNPPSARLAARDLASPVTRLSLMASRLIVHCSSLNSLGLRIHGCFRLLGCVVPEASGRCPTRNAPDRRRACRRSPSLRACGVAGVVDVHAEPAAYKLFACHQSDDSTGTRRVVPCYQPPLAAGATVFGWSGHPEIALAIGAYRRFTTAPVRPNSFRAYGQAVGLRE